MRRRLQRFFSLVAAGGALFPLCDGSPLCQIEHLHLSVGKDPATSMTVSFATLTHRQHLFRDEAIPACVWVGTERNHLERLVTEQKPPVRYFVSDDGSHAHNEYTSPYYHHIVIDDLQPNTEYYYRCSVSCTPLSASKGKAIAIDIEWEEASESLEEDDSDRRLSHIYNCQEPPVRHFVTAPPAGSFDEPVTFAILGDLGKERPYGAANFTMKHLYDHRHNFSAVMMLGDIAYNDGHAANWDRWFRFMDHYRAMQTVPWQIAAGNHDIELIADTGELFLAYEKRFLMPQAKPPESRLHTELQSLDMNDVFYPLDHDYGNSYYSFVYGPAYVIVINCYSSYEKGSKQRVWLEEELRSVDRSVTPWLFVMMHVPFYNTFKHHHDDQQIVRLKDNLETLFYGHSVNVVFSGHLHAYMRTKPCYKDKADQGGPVHVIVGEAGKVIDTDFYHATPEEWVAVRDTTWYGYGVLSIVNRTHAQWDWRHTHHGEHAVNMAWDSDVTWPSVQRDTVYFENQFFLNRRRRKHSL